MKIVTIKKELVMAYQKDPEMLRKTNRPCVMIVRLKYKGKRQDFAVPFRSNIPSKSPKKYYFPLPPRSSTRAHNRHGLHYIKMFPVTNEYILRYRIEGNQAAMLYKKIIDKNTKTIVRQCQNYLDDYVINGRESFATNIDFLLDELTKFK